MISIVRTESRHGILMLVCFVALPGCVTKSMISPSTDALLPSVRPLEAESGGGKPFTGLRLESRVAGSLMDLEFSPGLDVTAVIAGSPAESAGIRSGDRIVKANGKTLDTPDQFDTLVAASLEGKLALEVERAGGVATIELEPKRRDAQSTWQPTRYAERWKARFAARTVTLANGELACEVAEVEPNSPLHSTAIAVGTRILEIDRVRIRDARLLMEELARRPFGSSVTLGVEGVRGIDEIEVDLYAPAYRITACGVPILFSWRRDFAKDETHFAFVDLWLFSVYSWTRKVETRRHQLLGFTLYESGVGELAEEAGDEAEESRADGGSQ